MKFLLSVLFVLTASSAFASPEFKASGRGKTFKGPEGEVVTIIPVNDNAKLLVFAQNTYGPNSDKAVVYNYNNNHVMPTATFPNPTPRDDKDTSKVVVIEKDQGQWTYFDHLGEKKTMKIPLVYSEELSKKIDTKKLLAMAKDYK